MSDRAAIVSGTRDGVPWRAAKSLVKLYDQAVAAYPHRTNTGDDATIGNAEHAARTSDHNPNAAGVVTALDLAHDPEHGFNSYAFGDTLKAIRDARTKYVISNRRIFYGPRSPSHADAPTNWWKWETYNGDNPHDQHIHVSVGDDRFYDDETPWNIGVVPPPPDSERPILRRGSTGDDVMEAQKRLFVDGIYGPETEAKVKAFQKTHGLPQDGIVGLMTWAALLDTQPPASLEGWQADIKASFFGGAKDRNTSAYDGSVLNDTDEYAALPSRLAASLRLIDVRNHATGKMVKNVKIMDVGPWMTDDAYWQKSTRPLAEVSFQQRTPLPRGPNKGRIANGDGIDLSPRLFKDLGFDPNVGHGQVDWRFHLDESTLTPTPVTGATPEEHPMAATPTQVVVPVEPAVKSKVNWAALATAAFGVVAAFGIDVPESTRVLILTAATVVGPALIVIFRTWFTASVTPAAVEMNKL